MSFKNAFWGILLVALGALFLLKNLDLIYFSWWDIWRLWPIILVFIGISLLPIKGGIKVILSLVTIALAALFLATNPSWGPRWPFEIRWESHSNKDDRTAGRKIQEQRITEAFESGTTEALLDFDAAAGDFRIEGITSELFEFEKEGNLGQYSYSIKDLGNRKEIHITLDNVRTSRRNITNRVDMSINPTPVWDMNIDVGAAEIDLDLRDFMIDEISIDGGAASIDLFLGSLYTTTTVDIDAGASSIDIRIPESVACQVNSEAILSSKNLSGFTKVSPGTFVTDNFSDAEKNVVINVDVAVSSLTVKRY
jgi:hypothetical protein